MYPVFNHPNPVLPPMPAPGAPLAQATPPIFTSNQGRSAPPAERPGMAFAGDTFDQVEATLDRAKRTDFKRCYKLNERRMPAFTGRLFRKTYIEVPCDPPAQAPATPAPEPLCERRSRIRWGDGLLAEYKDLVKEPCPPDRKPT